jgi:hypothetical protein
MKPCGTRIKQGRHKAGYSFHMIKFFLKTERCQGMFCKKKKEKRSPCKVAVSHMW